MSRHWLAGPALSGRWWRRWESGGGIQYTGENEGVGYNDSNEQPDRAEAEAALGVYQSLYARMTHPRGLQPAAPVRG